MATRAAVDVYCDESRPELLLRTATKPGFAAIGALWMPHEYRDTFKTEIREIRLRYSTWGEIKWSKVSPANSEFHVALADYFVGAPELRFRAIVIDATKLDLERFHLRDGELGFYKFYYQLLLHWCVDGGEYRLFCDEKVNRDRTRLATLGRVLRNSCPGATFPVVQAVSSAESAGVQLCDLLLGSVQACFNTPAPSNAGKLDVISAIETGLGRRIRPTPKSASKFNVFQIALQGPVA